MFGIEALNIAIGLIFVFLLLSLLASSINELIAYAIGLRGRNLMDTITFMFDEAEENNTFNIRDKLTNDPLIKKLRTKRWFLSGNTNTRQPSYIAKEHFSEILISRLFETKVASVPVEQLLTKIDKFYPDASGHTRKILENIAEKSEGDIDKLKTGLEDWFDDTMILATEWYKKRIRWFLFIIGMLIAVSMNANTFRIVDNFSNDPEALGAVLARAEQFAQNPENIETLSNTPPQETAASSVPTAGPAIPDSLAHSAGTPVANADSARFAQLKAEYRDLKSQLAEASSMGIGWYDKATQKRVPITWVTPFGWLLTAFAISMGAPFWFNILRNAINLKNTAQRKAEAQAKKGSK